MGETEVIVAVGCWQAAYCFIRRFEKQNAFPKRLSWSQASTYFVPFSVYRVM
jgi:hypothetical protein